MSTQFVSATTGEWVATRFSGGTARGSCADVSRVLAVKEACDAGHEFLSEDSSHVWSGAEFWDLVKDRTWTFGEFGGTFELGTGDAATFLGL